MKCCEQYAAALSAFVDGELSENEKEEVLSHVEHCQNCREYLSELMIVHTMFEEMPELDAPEGFSERVLERVHEEKRERSRHRRAWPRVLAACFALLVVTAAAWKLAPAMVSSNDSAADCNTSGNDTASAPAASGDTAEDFTYSYSAVQKEGVQADASPFDTYDTEDGADDRSADASGGYATITLDVPAAAEFLHERGMAADQAVKFLVVNTMSPGESEPLLPPLLQLTRVHNYGAAWSSFSGARWLLIALTAAGMCAIAWLLVKIVRHPLGQWSLAIILGGGIGNLIDRVRLGYVVDMLDTMFMDFPVFNVADVFVVCGTVCALIYYLAFYSKSDEKNWGNKVDGTDPAANK